MQTVVGIFKSRQPAEQSFRALLSEGVPQDCLVFLSGEPDQQKIEGVRTTDAEPPGMGKAMGTYLGSVIGAGAGLSLGSAVASLFVPGVGPIMAAGLGAAALLGVGGAAAGADLGKSSENAMDEGIPRDDVFFYHDLLRRGRSLVIVSTDSEEIAKSAGSIMARNGGEDAEAARERWRTGNGEQLRRAS
jgi:hypothetical protein